MPIRRPRATTYQYVAGLKLRRPAFSGLARLLAKRGLVSVRTLPPNDLRRGAVVEILKDCTTDEALPHINRHDLLLQKGCGLNGIQEIFAALAKLGHIIESEGDSQIDLPVTTMAK